MDTTPKVTGLTAEDTFNRSTFLLQSIISQQSAISSNITYEELSCVGYNPAKGKLLAVVTIKQATGYSGGLCTNGSKEYVRFFVDFKDGSGFQDMGYTSFKVADISDAPVGAQHPLKYMTSLYINDEKYRRLLTCNQAVIPTVRAVLQWNNVPSTDPNVKPYYGNVKDVSIQLKRRKLIIWDDIFSLLKVKELPDFLAAINPQAPIELPAPVAPKLEQLFPLYQKAQVPDHRTFYSSVVSQISNGTKLSKLAAAYNLKDIQQLKVDIGALSKIILTPVTKADVSFEEVTCVGLNTAQDTLGAVIRIKKNSGFSGNMCSAGSQEHVAFWADWDNNGTFTQYLGTASVTVHDISNIPREGLYYNVELPVNLNGYIKSCQTPTIIRVRAVLSWSSYPSTTDPNALNTWGNRVDGIVQVRPSQAANVEGELTLVGNVDRDLIDPVTSLVNAQAVNPTIANNRPYGGWVSFSGIINRNGFNGLIKYKIEYKKQAAPATAFASVSTSESFAMIDFNPDPNLEYVDAQAPADGWFTYKANPAIGIYNEYNYLAGWSTLGLDDGIYSIRFSHTDALGNIVIADTFTVTICNEPMTISPTANLTLDTSKHLDLVINGGDCHCYDKTPAKHIIDGQLRATHPYFASWYLSLEPSSHTHGTVPTPASGVYNALGDIGGNESWTLDVINMDTCGYTLSLSAHTRVILNSSTVFPWYGVKAVGFSVSQVCPNG